MARLHPDDAFYPWHESRRGSKDSLKDYRWDGEPWVSGEGEPWMAGNAENIKRPECRHHFYAVILDSD